MATRFKNKRKSSKFPQLARRHEPKHVCCTDGFRQASSPVEVAPSDNFYDPARQELIKAEEAKRRRQINETRIALEKIQSRVDYTLTEYEGLTSHHQEPEDEVNFEVVQDPTQLYDLLANPKLRSKYQQKLTVFIVGYEEKLENMDKVLQQLQDFFIESQATAKSLELSSSLSEELVNLGDATEILESSLQTTQNAVQKLVGIKKGMSQVMSIVATYPDTNKGRKKMEKALIKTQEEASMLSKTLEEVKNKLKESSDRSTQLQLQLDMKSKECVKLRGTLDQLKGLQDGNERLKKELDAAQLALKNSQEELSIARNLLQKSKATTNVVAAPVDTEEDKKKILELEAQLEKEKSKYEGLMVEMESLVEDHKREVDTLNAEHEAEEQEARGRFEDQLKSLMEVDDMFDNEDMEEQRAESKAEIENVGDEETDFGASLITVAPTPDVPADREPESAVEATPTVAESPDVPADQEQESAVEAAAMISTSEVDLLKKEFKEKERKLLEEIEAIKTKSHKIVASLQLKLADSDSRFTAQKDKLMAELSASREELAQAKRESVELGRKLVYLEEEREKSLESLQEKVAKIAQLEVELQKSTASISLTLSPELQQEKALSIPSATPLPTNSPMQSVSTMPLVGLEEVFDREEDNDQQELSNILMTSLDERSNLFPSSLEHSAVTMDPAPLGSPSFLGGGGGGGGGGSFVGGLFSNQQLQQSSPPTQCSLSMLAASRLSHYSTQAPATAVSHGHPIVAEWNKAYDSILKFKRNLISMLKEHQTLIPQLPSLIEELEHMETHSMDKGQDVQSQVTEMRFGVTLLLHQIEQTLMESLGQLAASSSSFSKRAEKTTGAVQQAGSDAGEYSGTQNKELIATLACVTENFEQAEAGYKRALEKNEQTIAQLKNQMESLKIQVAALQQSLLYYTEREEDFIMFTRLDSERNTKALLSALNGRRIEQSMFTKLTNNMKEYIDISGKRLAMLSQRWQEKSNTDTLVQELHMSYPNDPVRRASITEGLEHLEKERQRKFSNSMEKLSAARHNLAHSLTHNLTCVEQQTRVFLIKPVIQAGPRQPRHLITPIPRPLPSSARRLQSRTASSPGGPVGTRQASRGSGSSTANFLRSTSSNVRLIQYFLQSQRKPVDVQEFVSCINTAIGGSPLRSTPGTPLRHLKSGQRSHHSTRLSSAAFPTAPGTAEDLITSSSTLLWHRDSSRCHDHVDEDHLSLQQPPFSKMVELDITRHRQPEALLGHILPNLQQHSHNHTPTTPLPQKLVSLPEEPPQVDPRSSFGWSHAVPPPIEVPSRITRAPLTAAV